MLNSCMKSVKNYIQGNYLNKRIITCDLLRKRIHVHRGSVDFTTPTKSTSMIVHNFTNSTKNIELFNANF